MLAQNLLLDSHMEMFWALSESSEYKKAVYKIIIDTSVYLDQSPIEFIFNKLTTTPVKNLDMSDFDLMSEIGKRCTDPKLKDGLSDFFWRLICESDNSDVEFVETCIAKFSGMIRLWSVA